MRVIRKPESFYSSFCSPRSKRQAHYAVAHATSAGERAWLTVRKGWRSVLLVSCPAPSGLSLRSYDYGATKAKRPVGLQTLGASGGELMDHTATDQSRKHSKSQFFNVRKWIKELAIGRAMRTMLTALLFAVDGETLTTDKYPVTIDKITQESGYSRAQTFEILNNLERAGLIERIRHRRQLPSGEWINDPTTYRFIVDDVERERLASVKATEPPRERHPKKERVPRKRAVSDEPVEPVNAPEPTPQPLPPIPVPERAKANVAPAYVDEMRRAPQLPNGDREVTELGDEIVLRAEEAFEEFAGVAKPRTIAAARVGLQSLKYSLATKMLDIRDGDLIEECEILESVPEWVRKCVAKNKSRSPVHLVGVLGTFIDGKGNGIRKMRRNLAMT